MTLTDGMKEMTMYPRFIELHASDNGEKVLYNIDHIVKTYEPLGQRCTPIYTDDGYDWSVRETYDEVKELLRSAGTAIQKADPRIDTSKCLSMDELCEPMMIGTPVWNSNTRAWMLVVDSALDNRSWVDLCDHCGKIVRYEPTDVKKFPLYRMRREHLGKACDDCLYDCHVDDNCPFKDYE